MGWGAVRLGIILKRRVGYLGPEGTFTHQAARSVEPEAVHIPFTSSLEVIGAVESGSANAGVIPIDNSIEGPVIPSIDALLSHEVAISGMIDVPISFTAFRARHSKATAAKIIVSHPHALAQCQGFIASQGLPTRATTSTAAASADIGVDEIALSADVCREIYDLETLETGVQDSLNGVTRFVRIEAVGCPMASEADATVVAIIPQDNNAGVLARISSTFHEYGHDLQGLVLRPLETVDFRYVFVFTVMASPQNSGLRECLCALTRAGDKIAVLGSFQSIPNTSSASGEVRRMRPLASTPEELALQLTPKA